MRREVDAALTAVTRTLNVNDVNPVALDPPKCISATLEAVGPEQGRKVSLQQLVKAFVSIHRVWRANVLITIVTFNSRFFADQGGVPGGAETRFSKSFCNQHIG